MWRGREVSVERECGEGDREVSVERERGECGEGER